MNKTKTAAIYRAKESADRSVWLSAQANELVIQDQNNLGWQIHWPLSQLRETLTPRGSLLLQWPPGAETVEITDLKLLKRAAWARQLPSKAHRSSPAKAFTWIVVALAVPYLMIELSAWTVRILPRSWEKKIFGGSNVFSSSELCGGKDSPGKQALDKLVHRIFPIFTVFPDDKEFSIDVHVARGKEKNAFTFPGGQIYVLEPLLKDAKSPEELAGVLAHEIEHVRKRHGTHAAVRKLMIHGVLGFFFSLMGMTPNFTLADELMGLQYSRGQEREADEGALLRLKAAKVNTIGFKNFFERKNKETNIPEILSTHPSDSSRAEMAAAAKNADTLPVLSSEDWGQLKGICQ